MADWMMNPEIHADEYEELMEFLADEGEEDDPFDPSGEDPVDLYGPWWE